MSRSIRAAFLQQHPVRLMLVVGLHGAFLWALIAGLQIHSSQQPADPVIARFLPPEPATPLPPPQTVQPRALTIPRPDIPEPPPVVIGLQPPSVIGVPEVPTSLGEGSNVAPAREAIVTAPAIDPRSPLTQPRYPPAALREGIEGNLALEVLVGTNGRVLDARVARTSGSALLDEAAADEARRHWKLRPATRDGLPIEQWYTLKVVFRLDQR